MTVGDFARIVGGTIRGAGADQVIQGFATDNRTVQPGDLFLAIRGERFDGHDFAAAAVAAGASAALVEHPVDAPHILVSNLVESLARLAKHFRGLFTGPVVGITGSAGKTTAKEFIAAALSPLGQILKTQGNKNTEYTAPLIWADLTPDTKAVVVEMAMRGFGQIQHLAEMARPTVAVITNIGYSHMSEVGSREGIAQAKAELLQALPPGGVSVLWAEDDYLDFLKAKAPDRVVTFGYSESADCRIESYRALNWSTSAIEGVCLGQRFEAELPAAGRHIALGAAAGLAVASMLDVPAAEAAKALANTKLPPLRMEVGDLNGAALLLDTYNAAPPSMLAAIETFTELPCEGRRFAVIGEMRELGPYSAQAHREIGVALAESGIDEMVFFSGDSALMSEEVLLRRGSAHVASSIEEVASFLRRPRKGDAVLVKGSRSLELERAVDMARNRLEAGT